jgi:hypothetical protein
MRLRAKYTSLRESEKEVETKNRIIPIIHRLSIRLLLVEYQTLHSNWKDLT